MAKFRTMYAIHHDCQCAIQSTSHNTYSLPNLVQAYPAPIGCVVW
jgi:hypothetical protein